MIADTSTKKHRTRETLMIPQRKQLILNFIHEYRRIHEISPKYLEIAKGIGLADNAEGTAHTYVQQLAKEGWLRIIPGVARGILPVFPPDRIYRDITDEDLKVIAHRQKNLRILRRL